MPLKFEIELPELKDFDWKLEQIVQGAAGTLAATVSNRIANTLGQRTGELAKSIRPGRPNADGSISIAPQGTHSGPQGKSNFAIMAAIQAKRGPLMTPTVEEEAQFGRAIELRVSQHFANSTTNGVIFHPRKLMK